METIGETHLGATRDEASSGGRGPEPAPSKGTLLVVDDDVGFAKALARELVGRGFAVDEAHDLTAARGAMNERAFDAALIDLNLANESGLDVLEGLNEAAASTPIVVMSGHASVAAAVEAMRRGAFDFVEKPLDLGRLEITLGRAIERAGLVRENAALRSTLGVRSGLGPALPPSALGKAMRRLYADLDRVAKLDVPVLIVGESGVGKEFVARAIHDRSPRADKPWIPVNCGALPPELVDSELFGHEKGAFTGARDRRPGLVEVAQGGTLFLDEVVELSLEAQVKLLRFIELGEFRRVGGSELLHARVRVVAATNRDPEAALRSARFREDLYFRLAAVTLRVPPLRERREELPVWVSHFLRMRGETQPFRDEVLAALGEREWRGNLRELRNAVDQLLLVGGPAKATAAALESIPPAYARGREKPEAEAAALPAPAPGEEEDLSLASWERRLILRALERHSWNQTRAARALGINPRTLYRRVRELGLKPEGGR